MRLIKRTAIALSCCLFQLVAQAQTAAVVPTNFSALYQALNGNVTTFQNSLPTTAVYPVSFGAELISANSNRGAGLITGSYAGVLMELDSLKAMGVSAVKVAIHFPILYPAFYQNQSDYQRYLNFYTKLAADIRARGLKIIVESGIVMSEPGLSNVNCGAYYNSLTLSQYENGRAQVAATVAQQIKPDFLTVLNEPDTEASQTGKPQLATAAGSLTFLNVILSALRQAGVNGISIGAGVGTWMPGYDAFVNAYAATPIQFIDMHIFPVTSDYLSRMSRIVSIAQKANKRVAISDAWPEKATAADLQSLSYSQLQARDPFSFWQPLDIAFLRAMTTFAKDQQLLFFSPFYSTYFHAYLNYPAVASLAANQLASQVYSQVAQNIGAGQYSLTGQMYSAMIASAPDTMRPSIPTNLTAVLKGQSAAFLTWNPSSDNVGVAGYAVYRGGTIVGTTFSPYYYDLNLAAATTYKYQVAAYDVAGNVSAPESPVSITTPGPATPVALSAKTTAGPRINLTWLPAGGGSAIAGFSIYRGTSATNQTLLTNTSGVSFTDTQTRAGTTYYYSVLSFDAQNNKSAPSKTISVITPR